MNISVNNQCNYICRQHINNHINNLPRLYQLIQYFCFQDPVKLQYWVTVTPHSQKNWHILEYTNSWKSYARYNSVNIPDISFIIIRIIAIICNIWQPGNKKAPRYAISGGSQQYLYLELCQIIYHISNKSIDVIVFVKLSLVIYNQEL